MNWNDWNNLNPCLLISQKCKHDNLHFDEDKYNMYPSSPWPDFGHIGDFSNYTLHWSINPLDNGSAEGARLIGSFHPVLFEVHPSWKCAVYVHVPRLCFIWLDTLCHFQWTVALAHTMISSPRRACYARKVHTRMKKANSIVRHVLQQQTPYQLELNLPKIVEVLAKNKWYQNKNDHLTELIIVSGYCKKGEYSVSGLASCTACPKGEYQPNIRGTSCLKCPDGTSTVDIGTQTVEDCKSEYESLVNLLTIQSDTR